MRRSTRTTLWVLGALCLSGIAALAAQPPGGRGRGGMRGRDGGPMAIFRELDLTEEQRSSMRELFEKARETGAQKRLMDAKQALEDAVENGATDEGAVRELAYQIGMAEGDAAVERIQMRNQIRSLLTAEQVQKLDELQAERRERREERRKRFEERLERRREGRERDPA